LLLLRRRLSLLLMVGMLWLLIVLVVLGLLDLKAILLRLSKCLGLGLLLRLLVLMESNGRSATRLHMMLLLGV